MQIKNRLFPYPVLNNEQFLSSYKNGEFELVYEITEDEDYSLDDIAVNWFSKHNND